MKGKRRGKINMLSETAEAFYRSPNSETLVRCLPYKEEGWDRCEKKSLKSASGGRGPTIPVRLVADCRVIAGPGPLSSSPATITIAAVHLLPGCQTCAHRLLQTIFEVFLSFHIFIFFNKSLPKTSHHISASPGAPGSLTCLPTLSYLQTILSQLSPHNKTHSSFLLVSNSKLLTTSLLFGSSALQNDFFESRPHPCVRVCQHYLKKKKNPDGHLHFDEAPLNKSSLWLRHAGCVLRTDELRSWYDSGAQPANTKGEEICAYFAVFQVFFFFFLKRHSKHRHALIKISGIRRRRWRKEMEELVEESGEQTTPGTLIFILVPPQANSTGYRNNLRVSFFSLHTGIVHCARRTEDIQDPWLPPTCKQKVQSRWAGEGMWTGCQSRQSLCISVLKERSSVHFFFKSWNLCMSFFFVVFVAK